MSRINEKLNHSQSSWVNWHSRPFGVTAPQAKTANYKSTKAANTIKMSGEASKNRMREGGAATASPTQLSTSFSSTKSLSSSPSSSSWLC